MLMDKVKFSLIPCLFLEIYFLENHFPNFSVFVCHQKSWSTKNTFRSTENTFQSTENTFQSKKNLVQFPGKCFPFWLCLFVIRKVGQRKTLSSQRKIWLGFQESVFLENLGRKHFPEVVKNLEMSLFADYFKFDHQTFDCYI